MEEKSSVLEHEPKKMQDEENESFSNMENISEKRVLVLVSAISIGVHKKVSSWYQSWIFHLRQDSFHPSH